MSPLSDLLVQASHFDHLPALVMVSGADGAVQYFNRAWRDYTGSADLDAWSDCLHPDDADRVAADWSAAVSRGARELSMEYRLKDGVSGAYRWHAARARAVMREDEIVGWVGVAVDVHDRKTSEAQLVQLYFEERSIADGFQKASLPTFGPSIGGFDVDAMYVPATHDLLTGGDWYDAYTLPNGSLLLSVGDVVGHGLQAAIIMSRIRQSIRTLAYRDPNRLPSPASIFKATEVTILSEYSEMMATAFIGIVEPRRKALMYCSAGHAPALLRRHGRVFETSNGGRPLGAAFGATRPDFTADISGVDLVFLHTDGLLESRHEYIEDQNRLRELLESWNGAVHGLCSAVIADLASNSLRDDVAAIAIAM